MFKTVAGPFNCCNSQGLSISLFLSIMFERLTEKLSAQDILLGLLGMVILIAIQFLLRHYVFGWLGIPANSYPDRMSLNFGFFAATSFVYVICGWIGLVGKFPRSSLVIGAVGGIVLPVLILWFFRGN